jgi:undecaprenyl-diphosphatase
MSRNRNRARALAVFVLTAFLAAPLSAQAGAAADTGPTFNAGGGELLAAEAAAPRMSIPQAAILGIVEGLTEYLPVSSTGHLTIVQALLGLWATPAEKSASDAYAICIQAGAIIAVLLIYFGRIRGMARGLIGRDREGLRLSGNLVMAFIPAAFFGLILEGRIKHFLYGVWPVAAAWLVGGLFILLVLPRRAAQEGRPLEGLRWRAALLIGCAQVAALWPGVSRSLATIAAGLFIGLSLPAAVEFSFLLGLLTLGAATLYEGLKLGPEIVGIFGWASPVVGLVVAAVAAFVAVKWMVEYLRTRSLALFGWYRIAMALLAGLLVVTGLLKA